MSNTRWKGVRAAQMPKTYVDPDGHLAYDGMMVQCVADDECRRSAYPDTMLCSQHDSLRNAGVEWYGVKVQQVDRLDLRAWVEAHLARRVELWLERDSADCPETPCWILPDVSRASSPRGRLARDGGQDGYPTPTWYGISIRMNRAVLSMAKGPPTVMGVGLQSSHLCGNKICVNPAHLEWETPSKNMERTPAGQRLGEDAVRGIRALMVYAAGDVPDRLMAARDAYPDVPADLIWNVARGRTYGDVAPGITGKVARALQEARSTRPIRMGQQDLFEQDAVC